MLFQLIGARLKVITNPVVEYLVLLQPVQYASENPLSSLHDSEQVREYRIPKVLVLCKYRSTRFINARCLDVGDCTLRAKVATANEISGREHTARYRSSPIEVR